MELAAGVILILMSIVHIIYGERKQVNVLKSLTNDSILIGSFRVMSLQGGLLLFAIGVIYILSFVGLISLTGVAIYFPVGLVLLNVLSVFIIAFTKHKKLFIITIPQFIIFAIIITLQILIIARV